MTPSLLALKYYNILWTGDINRLFDIFDRNICFTFEARDQPESNFTYNGIDKLFNDFFLPWNFSVERLNTCVKLFNMEELDNKCIVQYTIYQDHLDNNNKYRQYEFSAKEIITVNDASKISDIHLVRLYKK